MRHMGIAWYLHQEGAPTTTTEEFEPEFTTEHTTCKEVIYRLRGLAAQGAGGVVTQARA
jgi:hypothetical protein